MNSARIFHRYLHGTIFQGVQVGTTIDDKKCSINLDTSVLDRLNICTREVCGRRFFTIEPLVSKHSNKRISRII